MLHDALNWYPTISWIWFDINDIHSILLDIPYMISWRTQKLIPAESMEAFVATDQAWKGPDGWMVVRPSTRFSYLGCGFKPLMHVNTCQYVTIRQKYVHINVGNIDDKYRRIYDGLWTFLQLPLIATTLKYLLIVLVMGSLSGGCWLNAPEMILVEWSMVIIRWCLMGHFCLTSASHWISRSCNFSLVRFFYQIQSIQDQCQFVFLHHHSPTGWISSKL